jgi:hypothetical protein
MAVDGKGWLEANFQAYQLGPSSIRNFDHPTAQIASHGDVPRGLGQGIELIHTAVERVGNGKHHSD